MCGMFQYPKYIDIYTHNLIIYIYTQIFIQMYKFIFMDVTFVTDFASLCNFIKLKQKFEFLLIATI